MKTQIEKALDWFNREGIATTILYSNVHKCDKLYLVLGSFDIMVSDSEVEYRASLHEDDSPTYKFPRRCDITGKGMWEGYCFGDGQDYAIDKAGATTLAKQYGYDTLEEAFEDGAYYFTEWIEFDEDEWYESLNEDGSNAYAVSGDEG